MESDKTLLVIGAGISGLVCAIYAQRSGIKTTILEKAANPGGVSTSWKRKGYTFEAGGISFRSIVVNNYSRDTEYAPEGCTAVTAILPGHSYDYWKAAKERGDYYQLKQEVVSRFIDAIASLFPESAGCVEVSDMATPLTYERYCDTFEGSYMSEWLPWHFNCNAPIRYRKGLYFTGQRTAFSGGLPIAAETGRRCAQTVCKDMGTVFVSKNLRCNE